MNEKAESARPEEKFFWANGIEGWVFSLGYEFYVYGSCADDFFQTEVFEISEAKFILGKAGFCRLMGWWFCFNKRQKLVLNQPLVFEAGPLHYSVIDAGKNRI